MKTIYFVALIANLILFFLEFTGCYMQTKLLGRKSFRFYTYDSNLLGLISSAVMSYFLIVAMNTDNYVIPEWAGILKLMATVCLSVTFLVVALALAPMDSPNGYYKQLLKGDLIYQHTLSPWVAIISTLVLDPRISTNLHTALIIFIPTVVYAVIILIFNITKTIEGPYPFLRVYKQPVFVSILWGSGIIAGSFIVTVVIQYLQQSLPLL